MSEKERDIGDEILAEYDRLTQEAYDEGTMPEDETAGDWNVEQMEIAENTILSEEEQEVADLDRDYGTPRLVVSFSSLGPDW